ncbi:SH3 domain containing protein [Trichomonas vaginalis G3]|uniref:SH3 domain containing protein n=1 Tax=Trichomonas vaginalis (strain ATCC PRA-98 / G3) TaxID=412133 RepID=A2DWC3_TRIV3|nr:dedicator of cytokinesis family [Trichomonas vaginalis G3]EAY15263.1 SH3 domain containing protein [Trichomonas vaginalis G3]KAI5526423.1 dedicator of cytokinesis family [Trichomonas vaginalis G3]|eukprot:XP_001327486.1 SH3 domain containing protein [Trichomonas vaginalis G3]
MSQNPTVWESVNLEAKAIYPFSSEKDGYLTLIAGDSLQVFSQSQDWVYARNKNTYRCGICPKSFLKMGNTQNFNLIDIEAYEVLKNEKLHDMLHPICDIHGDSFYLPANYAQILTQYTKVLHLCKENRSPTELQELVRALNALKKYIGLPTDLKRSENESILTTTELRAVDLIEIPSDSRTMNFETTLSVTMKFTVTYNAEARICPRLYSIQGNKREILNAPADIYHHQSEKATKHSIRIENLPASILQTLVLELRVFSHVHFGADNNTPGPWANEYIGVGTEYLGTSDKPKFSDNPALQITRPPIALDETNTASFEIPLFMPKELISPLSTLNDILSGHNETYLPSQQLSKVLCELNIRKQNTEATTPDGKTAVHAIKESGSVTPSFHSNNLFLHLHTLIHKTAKKRTRILIRCLDFKQKKFINCFDRCEAFNGESFATVVEKGSKEFKIDEMASFNLDLIDEKDLKNVVLVIEVQRTSRSKGTVHQSSYGILPLTNTLDNAIIDTQAVTEIFLRKPISDNTAAGLSNVVMDWIKNPNSQTETKLSYELHLLSTKYIEVQNVTSDSHFLAYILNWDQAYQEHPEKAHDILTILKSFNLVKKFLIPYIVRALAISINIPELKETALESLQFILTSIDAMAQRHAETYLFFQRFIDLFKEDPKLAGIHGALMKAIDENIPLISETNPPSNEMNGRAQGPARCLSYYLQLSLLSIALSSKSENEGKGTSTIFVDALRSLAEKISAMFSDPKAKYMLITTIPFLANSYTLLCDLIWDHFNEDEAIKLIAGMVLPVLKIKNAWTDQNRLKTVSIKAISKPRAHTAIFNAILESFTATESHLFMIDTYPSLVALLFSVLHFSDDVDADILAIQNYIESILVLPEKENEISVDNFKQTIELYEKRLKDLLACNPEALMANCDEEQTKNLEKILKTKKINTSSNIYYVLLLIYFGGQKVLENSFKKRKDPAAFFWKLLVTFKIILEDENLTDKPYYFFISVPALINILSLVKKPENNFLLKDVVHLIDFINSFYKQVLKMNNKMNSTDLALYQRTYSYNLSPLAEMLPMLLKNIEQDQRFIPSIFVPFFHFYISTDNQNTRDEIANGFRLVVQADYRRSVATQKKDLDNIKIERSGNAFMDALNSIANDPTVAEKLLDIVLLIDQSSSGITEPAIAQFFERSKSIVKYMHDILTIPTDAPHEREKTQALTEILDSCLKANDIRLFVHFSSMLYDLHVRLNNNVEAAETLIYTASHLSWTDNTILAEGQGQEAQSASERKCACLNLAVNHFKTALFYESAISAIQELRYYYNNISYDYIALSKLIETEKELYKLISTGGEPIPLNKFFGVRFYGNFDKFWKDKTFIHRRDGFISNGSFLNQMSSWFPGSTIVSKPPEEVKEEMKVIYIFNLIPVVDEKDVDFVLEPPSEMMVRTTAKVTHFISEVPLRIRRKDDLGENAEGFIQTEEFVSPIPMQSYTKQVELKQIGEQVTLSPIEVAIRNLKQKSREILVTAARFYRDKYFYDKVDRNDLACLTRLLNGIADAGVNGGISVYLNLFFGDNNFAKEKVNVDNREALRTAIIDQLKTLKWGSNLHHFLVDETAILLHMNISSATNKMINLCKRILGEFNVNEQPTFTQLHDLSWLGPSEDAENEEEEQNE